MFFYKFEGLLKDRELFEYDDKQNEHTVQNICSKTSEFNEKFGPTAYYFVARYRKNSLVGGIIEENSKKVEKTLKEFLKYIGCECSAVKTSESTISAILVLLSDSAHFDLVYETKQVEEKFHLDTLKNGRVGRSFQYGENLIDTLEKKVLYDRSEKYLLSDSLSPELDRIYAGKARAKAYGHPVHYMFQTDDKEIRREGYKTLLSALYANGRLASMRYCYFDIRPGDYIVNTAYEGLYKVCTGGAVVIRYLANDESEEDEFAGNELDTIETMCNIAKRYRHEVLTVICLPKECKKAKDMFYENLGTVCIVEIEEDKARLDVARSFLKRLAKEKNVGADEALLSFVKDDEVYIATELQKAFDEWYNNKLKTKIYPQYKNISTVAKTAGKAVPKGVAYDELKEMVGLKEAKSVIYKAINYYKIQKLFEERGLKTQKPTMHMVFTGNPGTAKTSVARLFARIMRDNGLVSRGQLVEVGRGDLVGKYIGWTAQIVQKKFREAMGGVLFIDEAYSLVDWYKGGYGDEAISTIVQEMENHREDVVVIFAGYPNEMDLFLERNPGLRSRIAFHVPFADYSAEELCEIAELMGKKEDVKFEPAALEKLKDVFEQAKKSADFGNGRYVRNVIDEAKMTQAARLIGYDFEGITTSEMTTIKAEDITVCIEEKEKALQRIGF